MDSLNRNLPWIAAACAGGVTLGVLFAAGILNLASSDEQPSAADPLGQGTFSAATSSIAEQLAAPVEKSLDSAQILADLRRASSGSDEDNVTRNEPLAILTTIDVAEPELAPAPIQEADEGKGTSAAAFFANAQANLTLNDDCGEDLKALSAQTRIYFPSGGLTAKDTGLIQARVLGQIVGTCPGYTLAVRGHSDPSGNPQINLALSKQRAETVISRLGSGGIDTSSFIAVGVGDKEPSNVTEPEDRAYYDRRVEFEVIKESRTASLGNNGFIQTLSSDVSACASALQDEVAQIRLFYRARSITTSPSDLDLMKGVAARVDQCPGARLRIVGQHSDDIADRESVDTGRLRALIFMSSMIDAGFNSEKLIIGAPSYSVAVAGQPSMPRSRIDFQIITD